jgi:hypothetical protein
MKKFSLLSLIVYCWLGFYVCQAQDSTTSKVINTAASSGGDSVSLLQKTRQLEKGTANYLRALHQQNDGLVESAMINLIKMKYRHPDLDYNQIIDQLRYLARHGSTQSLRFMAYFTSLYLDDPETYGWLLQGDHEFALDSDYFFKIIEE